MARTGGMLSRVRTLGILKHRIRTGVRSRFVVFELKQQAETSHQTAPHGDRGENTNLRPSKTIAEGLSYQAKRAATGFADVDTAHEDQPTDETLVDLSKAQQNHIKQQTKLL